MTTAIYENLTQLNPTIAEAFNRVLAPIGAQVEGHRGNVLQLRLINRALAQSVKGMSFDEAVRRALASGEAAQYWQHFESAIYR